MTMFDGDHNLNRIDAVITSEFEVRAKSQEDEVAACDLVALFRQKLSSLPSLNSQESDLEGELLQPYPHGLIVRKAVALVLRFYNDQPYELWIENPCDLLPFPRTHDDAVDRVSEYLLLNKCAPFESKLSAFLLQDVEGKLFLLSERESTPGFRSAIETLIQHWQELAERYDLSAIIGEFRSHSDARHHTSQIGREVLLEGEAFDRSREREYLSSIARRYKMSNFEYLRFRLQSQMLHEAKIGQPDEQTATGVIYESGD